VCNVGAGQRTSLLELLQAVRDVTGIEILASHGAPRAGDVHDSLASLERARSALGYQPAVSLREGLVRTWQWFQERNQHPVPGLRA
jgi:UDP-glucose 4-epimerase